MTLRAFYGEEMDELQKKLCERAEELAEGEGLTVRFEETDRFPDTVNDEKCLDLVKSCAEKLGKQVVGHEQSILRFRRFRLLLKKMPRRDDLPGQWGRLCGSAYYRVRF